MHNAKLCGWIAAPELCQPILEELGIVLGDYVDGEFVDCLVPVDSLPNLEVMWGAVIWGLEDCPEPSRHYPAQAAALVSGALALANL